MFLKSNICEIVFLLIIIIKFNIESAVGLRILGLSVPSAVNYGQSVVLNCEYDLEGEGLYCVRYFKNNVQFFSYCPNSYPQGQMFSARGVYLDIGRSNASHVFLKKTDLSSSGIYECQVRIQPSMILRRSERQMNVYVVPPRVLNIEGAKDNYYINDPINLTCYSDPSIPVAQLSWFINDMMASEEMLIHYPLGPKSREGWQSAKLGLTLQASAQYFRNGAIKLSCKANFKLVNEFGATESIINGRPIPKQSFWLGIRANNSEVPFIDGMRSMYRLNDVLDINCTSTAKDVHLDWFVNDWLVMDSSKLINYDRKHETTKLGLRMVLDSHDKLNKLKLKCLARVGHDIDEYQENIIMITTNDPTTTSTSPTDQVLHSSTLTISSSSESPDFTTTTEPTNTEPSIAISESTNETFEDTDPPITKGRDTITEATNYSNEDYDEPSTSVSATTSISEQVSESSTMSTEIPSTETISNTASSITSKSDEKINSLSTTVATNLTEITKQTKESVTDSMLATNEYASTDNNEIHEDIDPDAWISTMTSGQEWVTEPTPAVEPTMPKILIAGSDESLYNLIFSLVFIIYDLHPFGLVTFYLTNKCQYDYLFQKFSETYFK